MVKCIFSGTLVCFVLLAAGLAFSAVGCVDANVDIPDYYRDEDRHTYRDDDWKDRDHDRDRREDKHQKKPNRRKLKKSEAYDIAKELVESEDMEADHFKIKDKKIDGVYWILFEHKRDKHKHRRRRRDHFAVRVARGRRGKTHVALYMDGQERDFRRRMDDDKVKKKEAYRFAERMAERQGARLGNYEIKDKKIDDNYWILFEHEDPRDGSWKNHFAVRVSKRGIATFYRR